ncbi:ABC transporter substrate-binding protein [Natronoglycomyces albus]|uniref:ABC transporter substrate-binding protein n=1 Tax=Natronoglycomyces albus TaxID=2811108 RepID=A0A895XRX7_9ACTN|nr:ABC transporter substrate-binding protein [Natronoglycomyces albus]QSB05316.1 ABC transporter substrate-binding protein [Natronoglycomyces albus]
MTRFRQRRVVTTAIVTASGLLAISACGAQVDAETEAETATVARCGEQVEYSLPQRAVVYEAGSADKMFVLGLTDHVHGYVMPPANPPVEDSPWADEYAQVEFLSDDLLNRELVVDADADFVVAGWNSGFSVERGITPEILDELGIMSFMHTETCYNYPGFAEHVEPFEGLFADLERLGAIFDVEDIANEVISQYRDRIAEVEQAAADRDDVSVFLYDSGTDKPFTAGNQVPPNDIISHAGATNIFADLEARWTEVGWEAVVEAQPEVIIILDYGDAPAQDKIDFLQTSPVTSALPAVVDENFFILDYNEGISGPRNIDGLENFSDYLDTLND